MKNKVFTFKHVDPDYDQHNFALVISDSKQSAGELFISEMNHRGYKWMKNTNSYTCECIGESDKDDCVVYIEYA